MESDENSQTNPVQQIAVFKSAAVLKTLKRTRYWKLKFLKLIESFKLNQVLEIAGFKSVENSQRLDYHTWNVLDYHTSNHLDMMVQKKKYQKSP